MTPEEINEVMNILKARADKAEEAVTDILDVLEDINCTGEVSKLLREHGRKG